MKKIKICSKINRFFTHKIKMDRRHRQLKHSSKYEKLVRDIRKYKLVQAFGHVFNIHGYRRHGIHLNKKPCQILFRKVSKDEPHGILYSHDHTRVDVIHDFENMDKIFNDHRVNCDGEGCVAPEEIFSQQHVYQNGSDSSSDDDDDDKKQPQKKLNYDNPVFVSSWSVFEQYLTDGKGVFITKWRIPTK